MSDAGEKVKGAMFRFSMAALVYVIVGAVAFVAATWIVYFGQEAFSAWFFPVVDKGDEWHPISILFLAVLTLASVWFVPPRVISLFNRARENHSPTR
jgi:hypothetical protein